MKVLQHPASITDFSVAPKMDLVPLKSIRRVFFAVILNFSFWTCFSAAAQNISTIAGDGTSAYGGDGGAATSAQLSFPSGVVLDSAGNLYVSDYYNQRIRKVDAAGNITTVAGNGTLSPGPNGDGGPAVDAQVSVSGKVAVDSAGNIYFANQASHTIRRIDTAGIITTIAGTGTIGTDGDGGPAISAQFQSPNSVVRDGAGNLYIVDYSHRVRKIDTSGVINTVAGTGTAGFNGDGILATKADLNSPSGIALDSAGNLYIADSFNHRIRKVDASGIITTVAGTGNAAFSGDEGAAIDAELNTPTDVTLDEAGNIYFADRDNHVIRKIGTDGTIVSVAGNGVAGFSGDGGPATSAQLYNPYSMAVGGAGNIYIGDQGNNRIRMVGGKSALTPEASIVCTPSELTDSANQVSTCTVTLSTPPAQDLSINLNLPVASLRYSTTCVSPMVVAANSSSASCTITAVPNTVAGDGNVTVPLSIAAPTLAGAYAVAGAPAQVVVKDDDVRSGAAPVPVPTLAQWALALLSLAVTGLAAAGWRRSPMS